MSVNVQEENNSLDKFYEQISELNEIAVESIQKDNGLLVYDYFIGYYTVLIKYLKVEGEDSKYYADITQKIKDMTEVDNYFMDTYNSHHGRDVQVAASNLNLTDLNQRKAAIVMFDQQLKMEQGKKIGLETTMNGVSEKTKEIVEQ